jgi:hypothetical protein
MWFPNGQERLITANLARHRSARLAAGAAARHHDVMPAIAEINIDLVSAGRAGSFFKPTESHLNQTEFFLMGRRNQESGSCPSSPRPPAAGARG